MVFVCAELWLQSNLYFTLFLELCQSSTWHYWLQGYNAHKEKMFMCFKNTFLDRYSSYIQYTIKQNLQVQQFFNSFIWITRSRSQFKCLKPEIIHYRSRSPCEFQSVILFPSSGHSLELHAVSPFSNSVEFEFPGTEFSVTPHNCQGWYMHFTCKKNVLLSHRCKTISYYNYCYKPYVWFSLLAGC